MSTKRTYTRWQSLFLALLMLAACILPAAASADADLSQKVTLTFNYAYGSQDKMITYQQANPLTLPDGTVVTAGDLKPMWSYLAGLMNADFVEVTVPGQKGADMITTECASNFSGANIYGGQSMGSSLMLYGAQGKFVNLSEKLEEGKLPAFKAYLDENPDVRKAITAYDGNIYHIPYISEVGEIARAMIMRGDWVMALLDAEGAAYDENDFATAYNGYWVGDNARVGENGGIVTPKEGIAVEKKTSQNIIEIQNALEVKNGKTLTEAFIQYIRDNYDYEKPSELFLGEKAAYDIDELVAIMRCVKANPAYLTNGAADTMWPMFSRQSNFREDMLRFSVYWGGVPCHGSDAYEDIEWTIDADGMLQYTYSTEGMYNVLNYFSQLYAEGLIYEDCLDLSVNTNFRSNLFKEDGTGFITFDYLSSSTTDALSHGLAVTMPPVGKINGVWQYYIANARTIKTDGWAISLAASTEEQIDRACAVFDWFFTDEGHLIQNYAMPEYIETDATYPGPNGTEWPKFTDWVVDSAAEVGKGIADFLRNYLGTQLSVGYAKEIGFEYQGSSERCMDGWELLNNSTLTIQTYAGKGPEGENPNFYKLIPPVFSFTTRQAESITQSTDFSGVDEYMFNIVRYGTKGGAPADTAYAKSYDEYLQFFKDKGLDTLVAAYQAAYYVMTAE